MRRRLPSLCLFLCALATPSSSALADHPTPYKGRFDFTTLDVHPVSATVLLARGSLAGNETHLGRFTGEVEYLVDLTTGAFAGALTKTAANDDRLDETLAGQFTATGSEGTFTITGSTGRFRGATGGGSFVGVWTDPDLITAHVTFDSSLAFAGAGGL
jgi:hypothetical protein